MSDEIHTVQEVAILLKVADEAVYTMAQNGESPAFKVHGQWGFRREDLDVWLASQVASTTTTSQPAKENASQRCPHLPSRASK